jgi:hypothetical protein
MSCVVTQQERPTPVGDPARADLVMVAGEVPKARVAANSAAAG